MPTENVITAAAMPRYSTISISVVPRLRRSAQCLLRRASPD
jgi:hypothetical protein